MFKMSNYATSTTPSLSANLSFIPFADSTNSFHPNNSSSTPVGLMDKLLRGCFYTMIFLVFLIALLAALAFYRRVCILQAENSTVEVPEDFISPASIPDDLREHVLPDPQVHWLFDHVQLKFTYSTTSESSTDPTVHGNIFSIVQFYLQSAKLYFCST